MASSKMLKYFEIEVNNQWRGGWDPAGHKLLSSSFTRGNLCTCKKAEQKSITELVGRKLD